MKRTRPISTTELTDARIAREPTGASSSLTLRQRPGQLHDQQRREQRAEPRCSPVPQRVRPVPLGRVLARRVEQHDDEEEEHHDGAGVDDDLRHGDKRRVELNVEPDSAPNDAMSSSTLYIGFRCPMTSVDAPIASAENA